MHDRGRARPRRDVALPSPVGFDNQARSGDLRNVTNRILFALVVLLTVGACAEREVRTRRVPTDDAGTLDASALDSGGQMDLGGRDLGATVDLGTSDLGSSDLGSSDLGTRDLGTADLGTADLGVDLGVRDLGAADLGAADLGVRDLGAADLGRDAGPISGGAVAFPTTGDTWSRSGEHLWEAGSSVQGVRAVSLAAVGRAVVAATIEGNTLTCDGQDMRLVIDGRVAGTFTIRSGDTTLALDFTFASAPVSGGAVTLRYENAREVASGCGSARFDKMFSTITLAP